MEFDPNTTIADMLEAIPSAASVLQRFGMHAERSDSRTVRQICVDHRVPIEDFLRAFDDIDWQRESPIC